MSRAVGTALAVLGIIGVIVVVLVTGGPPAQRNSDATSDVTIEGSDGPKDPSAADIAEASVSRQGDEVVFVAQMVTDLPDRVEGALEFRWDLYEGGESNWIVFASIARDVSASISSTFSGYGASTQDQTLPGRVSIEGNKLTVGIRVAEVEAFPQEFEWMLRTTLDARRGDPGSGTATDTAPDSGRGAFSE